jgi:hypothetical protein
MMSFNSGITLARMTNQVKKTDPPVEVDQQIHVAVRTGLVSCHGAEELQRLDAELFPKLDSAFSQNPQNIVTSHWLSPVSPPSIILTACRLARGPFPL